MNSAQHKVLDHAFLVIRALPNGLFVGQSSEECSEANNKVLKKDEVEHSRQDSHINRITDIVMRQIDRSHPVTLDNLMKRRVTGKRKTRKAIPIEVLRLTKEWKEEDEGEGAEAEEADGIDYGDCQNCGEVLHVYDFYIGNPSSLLCRNCRYLL